MIDLNCPHCKAPLTEEQIRRLVGSLNGRLGGRKPRLAPVRVIVSNNAVAVNNPDAMPSVIVERELVPFDEL
jgi:hypothetical protein